MHIEVSYQESFLCNSPVSRELLMDCEENVVAFSVWQICATLT
jgi:hypothetical protein